MDSAKYLDEAKEKLGLVSDYAFAKTLGISQPTMTRYRKGEGFFDDYMCFRLAEILDIDVRQLIAETKAETEKNPRKQQFWRDQLVMVAGKAIKGGLNKLRIMYIMLN